MPGDLASFVCFITLVDCGFPVVCRLLAVMTQIMGPLKIALQLGVQNFWAVDMLEKIV